MSDSLKNQLLGLGFKPSPQPERKPVPAPRRDGGKGKGAVGGKHEAKPGRRDPSRRADAGPARTGRNREEMDLAKAYAIRAQREKQERIEAEQKKQELARQRREAKARLAEWIKDKACNVADAEIARHFPYGGKIKRIYVTAEQLKALNAGELGVVQDGGRYLLVSAAHLAEAAAIFPDAIALKVDPEAPVAEDPYADPRFQVPDDLVW